MATDSAPGQNHPFKGERPPANGPTLTAAFKPEGDHGRLQAWAVISSP